MCQRAIKHHHNNNKIIRSSLIRVFIVNLLFCLHLLDTLLHVNPCFSDFGLITEMLHGNVPLSEECDTFDLSDTALPMVDFLSPAVGMTTFFLKLGDDALLSWSPGLRSPSLLDEPSFWSIWSDLVFLVSEVFDFGLSGPGCVSSCPVLSLCGT